MYGCRSFECILLLFWSGVRNRKKTSYNLKMTLWDAKMTLRILHFCLSSYQKHYFTVFNNYIYIILCMPRIAKIKRKILLGLKAQ